MILRHVAKSEIKRAVVFTGSNFNEVKTVFPYAVKNSRGQVVLPSNGYGPYIVKRGDYLIETGDAARWNCIPKRVFNMTRHVINM